MKILNARRQPEIAAARAPARERRCADRAAGDRPRCARSREFPWTLVASALRVAPRNDECWRCEAISWASDCAGVEPPPTSERPSAISISASEAATCGWERIVRISGCAWQISSSGQADHALRGNIVPGAAKIGAQRDFQRRDGQFVHAQGAEQRMPPHLRDEFLFPGDDAGLRPAQQVCRR